MNKHDLILKVAQQTQLAQKDVIMVLDTLLDEIVSAVTDGEKVQFVGFGTFEAKERAERVGINPKTKEAIMIPKSRKPAFKAGKVFKQNVNDFFAKAKRKYCYRVYVC